jgi:hypothetical protein
MPSYSTASQQQQQWRGYRERRKKDQWSVRFICYSVRVWFYSPTTVYILYYTSQREHTAQPSPYIVSFLSPNGKYISAVLLSDVHHRLNLPPIFYPHLIRILAMLYYILIFNFNPTPKKEYFSVLFYIFFILFYIKERRKRLGQQLSQELITYSNVVRWRPTTHTHTEKSSELREREIIIKKGGHTHTHTIEPKGKKK